MSNTRRRMSARHNRSHHDIHALFHLYAGNATILNLRHIPGDIGAEALLDRGVVRVDRATPWGNPFPIGRKYGNRTEFGRTLPSLATRERRSAGSTNMCGSTWDASTDPTRTRWSC